MTQVRPRAATSRRIETAKFSEVFLKSRKRYYLHWMLDAGSVPHSTTIKSKSCGNAAFFSLFLAIIGLACKALRLYQKQHTYTAVSPTFPGSTLLSRETLKIRLQRSRLPKLPHVLLQPGDEIGAPIAHFAPDLDVRQAVAPGGAPDRQRLRRHRALLRPAGCRAVRGGWRWPGRNSGL